MRINNEFTFIRKRSSVWVRFEQEHITAAVLRAAAAIGGFRNDFLLGARHRFPASFTAAYVDPSGALLPDDKIAQIVSDLAIHMLNFKMGISETQHPTIEEIQDAVEYALYASGLVDTYEAYRTYRWGRTKLRQGEIKLEEFIATGQPMNIVEKIENFNRDQSCGSIEELNEIVNTGRFAQVVEAGVAAFEQDLDALVKRVAERMPLLLIVAGCSSSGKSTTAWLLEQRLAREGIECSRMELDHYFLDYMNHPRDRHGDFDYETPQALDLHQINNDVQRLLSGEKVTPDIYDFEAGAKRPGSVTYSLEGGKLLLLDSLYGAFPPMTACVPRDEKMILHIEALHTINEKADGSGQQVRPTDVRMLRRMIRDSRPQDVGGRGHPVERTLGHWHYVRRGELRDLIPYIGTVDRVINGSFAFDLPVLRKFIGDRFPSLEGFARRGRIDALVRGTRVRGFLEQTRPQEDTSYAVIPKDCILREFIGFSD